MTLTTRPTCDRPAPAPVEPPAPAARLIVGIPTVGRSSILTDTVKALVLQTRLPDLLILSISQESDIDRQALSDLPFPAIVLTGTRGLPAQRNRILEKLTATDLLLFLDDDFLMAPEYLQRLEALLEADSEIVMATGTVLADGVVGEGYDHAKGVALLGGTAPPADTSVIEEIYNGYGCNMAMRGRPIVGHQLRFDENLPLYGWLEDVDFSRQLAPFGRIVRSSGLCGVHLGTKTSRTPGQRLGYSQIANPVYLNSKGTFAGSRAFKIMARNTVSNVLYSVRPRPWTDSRGRLKGNLIALADLMRGRLSPGRALDL